MKTVSLSGKQLKFKELQCGALFVEGTTYDSAIYIKVVDPANPTQYMAVCIYSTAYDECLEGGWYCFPDDSKVVEIDVDIVIEPKRG